jgi:hypothetical protein
LPDGKYFKPKFPVWVNFGGCCNGRCWYIFTAIRYILWPFGMFVGHFDDFHPFSAKILAFFLKTNVVIQFLIKLAVF